VTWSRLHGSPKRLFAQVGRGFGISESCLQRWLKLDDVEEGRRPGVSPAESAELREAKKRSRLLRQGSRFCGGRRCIWDGTRYGWRSSFAGGPPARLFKVAGAGR